MPSWNRYPAAFAFETTECLTTLSTDKLSLLDDGGSDNLSVDSVDLVSWFEPIGTTDRVWLRGVRSVQFPKPMK